MGWDEMFPCEKADYSVNTQSEGLLEFTVLRVWREELISEILGDPRDKADTLVIQTLIKYSLYRYGNTLVTADSYRQDPTVIERINLNINQNELEIFSIEFFEHHKYMIQKGKTFKLEDGFNPEDLYMEEEVFKWSENPITKVHELWNKYYERQLKLLERIGIVTKKVPTGIMNIMDRQRRNESRREVEIPIMQMQTGSIIEQKIRVDTAILKIPNLLNELINNLKISDETNLDYLNISNQYQREQLEIAKQNTKQAQEQSERAQEQSRRAMLISLLAVGISLVLGAVSIIISHIDSNSTTKVLSRDLEKIRVEVSKANLKQDLSEGIQSINISIGELKNRIHTDQKDNVKKVK